MNSNANRSEAQREEFPDGSAIVTYVDGSMLIVESKSAKATVLSESRSVTYDDPPPPPRE